MRATPLSLALILVLSASLAAENPADRKDSSAPEKQSQPVRGKKKGKPIQMMIIGENGSYTHPDPTASDAMETISRQQGGHGTFGDVDIGGTTNPKPKPDEKTPQEEGSQASAGPAAGLGPTDLVPREMLGLPPKTQSGSSVVSAVAGDPESGTKRKASLKWPVEDGGDVQDRKRYSLWEGLAAPLELPGGKVSEVSLDKASELSRKDYDSHILGIRRRPDHASGVRMSHTSADLAMNETSSAEAAEVFVNFDLDLSEKSPEAGLLASAEVRPGPEETLRDALAALSRVGFRPDPRFNALPSRAGKISLSGWMPIDRIQAAMQVPTVSRLEIQGSVPGRSAYSGSTSDVLVGIRIPGVDPAQGITGEAEVEVRRYYRSVVGRLASRAGFRLKRTIGYQTAPGGKDLVIVVEGRVPIRNLSRLMAHRDVVKVAPAPPASAERSLVKKTAKAGFISFVAARAPLLIGITLLLLIPAIGSWLLRFMETLTPYSRN